MNFKINYKLLASAIAIIFFAPFIAKAQTDSSKTVLALNIGYYMNNNKAIYVIANAKTKIAGKFQKVKDVTVNIYLDKDSAGNLMGKVVTDKNGLAKAMLPPALKSLWDASTKHSFIAVSEANKAFESTTAEAAISKSKITLDTISDGDVRSIVVKVTSFDGTVWMPVAAVEMKLGVSRDGGSGLLSAGDDATYTTDSTGTVTAEYKKVNLPGDEKGNILLIAKVEENEQLGSLVIEKTVPWGVVTKTDNSFFTQRTLWSTRFRTPFWLLFMAYSIVIGVWGTIVYLILQIIKIKKLGNAVA
jgi:hypothetical protein